MPLTARVINAVRAQSERSGAVILAEGIETEAHLRRALAMGATLGQGWLFGRPEPLELPADQGSSPPWAGRVRAGLPRRAADDRDERTPFEPIVDPGSVLYEEIATKAALVGALGVGLPSRPGKGIRGAGLAPDDPLGGEWDVVVISPHFAGGLCRPRPW